MSTTGIYDQSVALRTVASVRSQQSLNCSATTPLLLNDISEDPMGGVRVAIHYPYDTETKLYKRRWVMLTAFALLGFMQSLFWNTWGSISSSAKIVFPTWTDATIALLSNWGNICYVLFLLPVVWVMDTKGLRTSTVLASSLVFLGAGIRCITMDSVIETWFIHAGHFVNGIAGIVLFAGPPQLSAAWFPMKERTTATGIIYVITSLGTAAGSVLPPTIVDEFLPDANPREQQLMREQVVRLLYIQFIFAALMFLWIIIYFPAKPPFPPSVTASIDRLKFFSGLRRLSRNKDIWLVGISFGVSTAIYSSWITVIHISLEVLGMDQAIKEGWYLLLQIVAREKEAGWIGFYSLLGGCVGTYVASRLCDGVQLQKSSCGSSSGDGGGLVRGGTCFKPVYSKLRYLFYRNKLGIWCRHNLESLNSKLIDLLGGKMKLLLTTGLLGSALCFVWFMGICLKLLPCSRVSLYVALIMGGAFNYGLQPVFMEMGAEVAYPIGEAVVGGFLTGIFNVIGTFFLFIFFIPNIGYFWMNWCLVVSCIAAIPVMLLVNESYARSDVDNQQLQPLLES